MGKQHNFRFYKKYIKLLSHSPNKKLTTELIKVAPVPVLKLISNAGIFASHGNNIKLSDKQKQVFKKHRKLFTILQEPKGDFNSKRKYLVQKGNAAFIPILLSTVVPLVADLIFRGLSRK